jgi:hypothetical protein
VARLGADQLPLLVDTNDHKGGATQKGIIANGFECSALGMNGKFAIPSTLGARASFVGRHGKKNPTTTIDECQMKARTNGNCNTGGMLLGKLFVVAKFGHFESMRPQFDIVTLPIYSIFLKEPKLNLFVFFRMFGQESLEAAVRDHSESTPARTLLQNFQHFIGLYNIVEPTLIEGKPTCIINGHTYAFERAILHKQEVLFRVGSASKRALVIGAYLGHAVLMLLISNPKLHITLVEDDPAVRAPEIIQYLQEHFPHRITLYTWGIANTLAHLPDRAFDLVYMDRDYSYPLIANYMNELFRLSRQGAFYVIDGYEMVKPTIDNWIAQGRMNKVMVSPCLWTSIVTNLCK